MYNFNTIYNMADSKEEIDLTDEERQEVLKKIFEHLKPQDLNNIL